MNKGLDLIQRQQPEFINDFPTGNICIGVTKEELTELEKELKEGEKNKLVLEIIKQYIHIYCIAPNDCGGVRIWFTEDGKHFIDMPQEEYDLLKEVLL